jgi:hypothetical protein
VYKRQDLDNLTDRLVEVYAKKTKAHLSQKVVPFAKRVRDSMRREVDAIYSQNEFGTIVTELFKKATEIYKFPVEVYNSQFASDFQDLYKVRVSEVVDQISFEMYVKKIVDYIFHDNLSRYLHLKDAAAASLTVEVDRLWKIDVQQFKRVLQIACNCDTIYSTFGELLLSHLYFMFLKIEPITIGDFYENDRSAEERESLNDAIKNIELCVSLCE